MRKTCVDDTVAGMHSPSRAHGYGGDSIGQSNAGPSPLGPLGSFGKTSAFCSEVISSQDDKLGAFIRMVSQESSLEEQNSSKPAKQVLGVDTSHADSPSSSSVYLPQTVLQVVATSLRASCVVVAVLHKDSFAPWTTTSSSDDSATPDIVPMVLDDTVPPGMQASSSEAPAVGRDRLAETILCTPRINLPEMVSFSPALQAVMIGQVVTTEGLPLPKAFEVALGAPPVAFQACPITLEDGWGRFDGVIYALWVDLAACCPTSQQVMANAARSLPLLMATRESARQAELLGRQFDAILQRMPQAVVFVDDELGQVVVNPAAAHLLELPACGEVDPMRIAAAMRQLAERSGSRTDLQRWFSLVASVAETVIEEEWRLSNPTRVLRVQSCPVSSTANTAHGRLWIFQDLTAEHKAREAIVAANRAKSQFLAMMSHELRTPMTGVLGMLDLLKLTEMEQEQAALLKVMQASAEGLMAVLNNILDFSKMEAGRIMLEKIDFNVAHLLRQVEMMFEIPLADKGLALHIRFPSRLHLALCGDPMRLKQVLVNLVSNAVKNTERGSVSISWLPCSAPSQAGPCLPLREPLLQEQAMGRWGRPLHDDCQLACPSPMHLAMGEGDDSGADVLFRGSRSCPFEQPNRVQVQATIPPPPLDLQAGSEMEVSPGLEAPGQINLPAELSHRDHHMASVKIDVARLQCSSSSSESISHNLPSPSTNANFLGGTDIGMPQQPTDLARQREACSNSPAAQNPSLGLRQANCNPGCRQDASRGGQIPQSLLRVKWRLEDVQLSASGPWKGRDISGPSGSGPVDLFKDDPEGQHGMPSVPVGKAKLWGEEGQNEEETEQTKDDQVQWFRVEVADTGAGIAQERIAGLFEASKAGSRLRRDVGGTGLGLPICKGLLELMGGKIWIESTVGVGSKFTFLVPLLAAKDPSTVMGEGATSASRYDFRSLSPKPPTLGAVLPLTKGDEAQQQMEEAKEKLLVLVAEDNKVNQLLINKIFKHYGHQVEVVGNGKLALEAVQEKAYDLVLMDLQMPILDGLGATKAIRRLNGPAATLPIYALTADAMAPEIEEAGMDGFLSKPIVWDKLSLVVDKVLAKKEEAKFRRFPTTGTVSSPRHM